VHEEVSLMAHEELDPHHAYPRLRRPARVAGRERRRLEGVRIRRRWLPACRFGLAKAASTHPQNRRPTYLHVSGFHRRRQFLPRDGRYLRSLPYQVIFSLSLYIQLIGLN